MTVRKFLLASAALSLAASPAIAESMSDRSLKPLEGESEISDTSGISDVLVGFLGGLLAGGVILIAVDYDDDDDPISP